MLEETRNDLKSMIILFKAHSALIEFIKEDIKDSGFDLNEFGVLEVIYHKKRLTINEIFEKVLIANSSLTYILNKLEKKDIIKREKCLNDKRITYIELTKNGVNISNSIFPKHYNNLKEIFSILNEEEKKALNKILKKVGFKAKEGLLK